MFIQTEQTPNPATLKFLPGRDVLGHGTADFPTVETAVRSPLAQRLFEIEGVAGVFLGADFVTITKEGDRDWYLLKPSILGVIMEHFTAGRPSSTRRPPTTTPPMRTTTRSSPRSRNCWTPASVRRSPRTAATSRSRASRTASST